MTWYNPTTWLQKANPAQEQIRNEEGNNIGSTAPVTYLQAFEKLESVNRGVNMIASACASLDYDVKDKTHEGRFPGLRQAGLLRLLNTRPNPHQSAVEFRTALFTDFLLEGNIFMYYDGTFLYHLPAGNVEIHPDPKTFVNKYTYNNVTTFAPDEVIHIHDKYFLH